MRVVKVSQHSERHENCVRAQMREWKIAPDAILYNAIIDALWETGVIWAQRKVQPNPKNPKILT